eukprot:TRINITY_DN999_c0_g1_i1.p1 TRINITY_DN999_c0_g1~~TRINITY_DN999_c0_g1_i1.p1  ORF type:complete len:138 (-),score=24.12 TRINITY_DN999_c0_g1_i1:273-686(-)
MSRPIRTSSIARNNSSKSKKLARTSEPRSKSANSILPAIDENQPELFVGGAQAEPDASQENALSSSPVIGNNRKARSGQKNVGDRRRSAPEMSGSPPSSTSVEPDRQVAMARLRTNMFLVSSSMEDILMEDESKHAQ